MERQKEEVVEIPRPSINDMKKVDRVKLLASIHQSGAGEVHKVEKFHGNSHWGESYIAIHITCAHLHTICTQMCCWYA